MMVKFNLTNDSPVYLDPRAVTVVHQDFNNKDKTIVYVGQGTENSAFLVNESLAEVLTILGEKQ